MTKYGIVREMSVHSVKFDPGDITPIIPETGVFLRFRATQSSVEIPDVEDRPLGKGEGLLFVGRIQAKALIQVLEEALTHLED